MLVGKLIFKLKTPVIFCPAGLKIGRLISFSGFASHGKPPRE
jgi:hypothetical protein